MSLKSLETQSVHIDSGFNLNLRGNGQVSVVNQLRHDQKSLKKDFSTVTEHTAEFGNHTIPPKKVCQPHQKKRGVSATPQKKYHPGNNNPTQFPGSLDAADGLCLEPGGEAEKTDFAPCRGDRLPNSTNFP